MANITWEYACPIGDEAIVDALEADFGLRLPASYRALIPTHSNARPTPCLFLTQSGAERGICKLLPLQRDLPENLWRRNAHFDGRYFAFASDGFGNYLCFDAQDGMSVAFLDHETDEADPVAPSFAAFLALLY